MTCEKMLLVCNWKGTSWTFPKGKINQGEEEMACAAREAPMRFATTPPGALGESESTRTRRTRVQYKEGLLSTREMGHMHDMRDIHGMHDTHMHDMDEVRQA